MILYLVRHGETVDNKFGLIQGQRDVELSDKGRVDAAKLKDLVRSLDIDVVISSPLSRAVETAKIITDGKYPINTDDRITERNWGMIEGVKFDTVDSYKNWNFNINTNDNYIEPLRVRPKSWIMEAIPFIRDSLKHIAILDLPLT